jgi:hypothetical protein
VLQKGCECRERVERKGATLTVTGEEAVPRGCSGLGLLLRQTWDSCVSLAGGWL